jgi:hypothetical protein
VSDFVIGTDVVEEGLDLAQALFYAKINKATSKDFLWGKRSGVGVMPV